MTRRSGTTPCGLECRWGRGRGSKNRSPDANVQWGVDQDCPADSFLRLDIKAVRKPLSQCMLTGLAMKMVP